MRTLLSVVNINLSGGYWFTCSFYQSGTDCRIKFWGTLHYFVSLLYTSTVSRIISFCKYDFCLQHVACLINCTVRQNSLLLQCVTMGLNLISVGTYIFGKFLQVHCALQHFKASAVDNLINIMCKQNCKGRYMYICVW